MIEVPHTAPTAIGRDGITRPYFSELQILGASDLMALGSYLRDMRRRHNLGPHTWGIVAGLELWQLKDDAGKAEVYVSPGLAIDGFGREIVLLDPYRLSAGHFAHIPYDAGMADGQDAPVWIGYAERRTQPARPGFEACTDADEGRRIVETFRIEVGPRAANEQRDRLQHNRGFAAPQSAHTQVPPDGSLPDQRFPGEEPPARWLIQLGVVRWKPSDGSVGGGGETAPGEFGTPAIAPSRRPMAGLIGAELLAPDRGVVVRRRASAVRPTDPVFLDSVLAVVDKAAFADQLHVFGETHLRARLALHEGAPAGNEVLLAIARHRAAAAAGMPERADLWLSIGKPGGKESGLVVGPVENDKPKPYFTVSDDDKVEVPTGSLTVGGGVVARRLTVRENADVEHDLKVKGTTTLEGNLRLKPPAKVVGGLTIDGDARITGDATVGAGGNGSLLTRHVDGKSYLTDDDDHLYLNYATGKDVHVGGNAESSLRVAGDVYVRGVKMQMPIDVKVGTETVVTPPFAGPSPPPPPSWPPPALPPLERTGVHTFSLSSRLPRVAGAQMMVALSDIENSVPVISTRWEVRMESAPARVTDNTFEFRVRWRTWDLDGQIHKFSYVAVFTP